MIHSLHRWTRSADRCTRWKQDCWVGLDKHINLYNSVWSIIFCGYYYDKRFSLCLSLSRSRIYMSCLETNRVQKCIEWAWIHLSPNLLLQIVFKEAEDVQSVQEASSRDSDFSQATVCNPLPKICKACQKMRTFEKQIVKPAQHDFWQKLSGKDLHSGSGDHIKGLNPERDEEHFAEKNDQISDKETPVISTKGDVSLQSCPLCQIVFPEG